MLKRAYVWTARFCLFLIEGPDRPWWSVWIPMWLGIAMILVNSQLVRAPLWVRLSPVLLILLSAIWKTVRVYQIRAVTAIATDRTGACPFCGYRLDGVMVDLCPECGRKPRAEAEHLRATMGISVKSSEP